MSTRTDTVSAPLASDRPALPNATLLLLIGLAGLGLTAMGSFISGPGTFAISWLLGLTFWTGITIGILFLVLLHHIFDAGWSTVVRRPLEHWLSVFKWLALLFVPLLLLTWFYDAGILWKWMDPTAAVGEHGTVQEDVLYAKKQGYLDMGFFTLRTALYFGSWVALAFFLRKASFSQDNDGDIRWTFMNRRTAAIGLILGALTATFAAIDWIKSLEYHWFSTMYGVWFFASCVRAALASAALLCLYLVRTGPLRGIFNSTHLYDLGKLQLSFTVFWGYITFSQYFLIWNANVPEETFWYVIREHGNWWHVGMVLVFGYFLIPFLCLLSYRLKVTAKGMTFISLWILAIFLVDLYYNILPSRKDGYGDPVPFAVSFWDITALVGVGGVCAWAFLRSWTTTRVIPIRDPRILESLHHHE